MRVCFSLPQVSLFPEGVVTTLVPGHVSLLYSNLMVLLIMPLMSLAIKN